MWESCAARSLKIREYIIQLTSKGGCFIGASMSAVDVLVYLYEKFLHIPDPLDPARDLFLLSKGHDVPALYGLFVELGWLNKERLMSHMDGIDNIYWHPNVSVPGIEFHSGSLGHLLPVSVGLAIDCKMKEDDRKVVVMVGDGELNEGSNWEALLVAAAYKLDNLYVVVDRNGFQANVKTEELIPLEPLAEKFTSFGAKVFEVDGHCFESLDKTFHNALVAEEKPKVIIAKTTRGKGLPSIESKANKWFCCFSDDEVSELITELHGGNNANIVSDEIVAR